MPGGGRGGGGGGGRGGSRGGFSRVSGQGRGHPHGRGGGFGGHARGGVGDDMSRRALSNASASSGGGEMGLDEFLQDAQELERRRGIMTIGQRNAGSGRTGGRGFTQISTVGRGGASFGGNAGRGRGDDNLFGKQSY